MYCCHNWSCIGGEGMSKVLVYSIIYIVGVIISACAQILLKKSAMVERETKIKEYLNFQTMFAYAIFFSATLCTVFSYKYVPMSMGPILGTTEYLFIALLSYFILKEKITRKKKIGIFVIMIGVLIFSV